MKYKLTIEGTKDEIEKAKRLDHSIMVYDEGSTVCQRWNKKPEVEFKIVEPKYRVKTLVELCAEFGESVKIDPGTYGNARIRVGDRGINVNDLGLVNANYDTQTAEWKRIFLRRLRNEK